ncbi:hypothetical protein [Sorangium sp. So ce542]|uniref:hypothetical protein n=1 Tax=Sorangium sp. So ce542 TaxID=3133316 RepID=UPI003F643FB7
MTITAISRSALGVAGILCAAAPALALPSLENTARLESTALSPATVYEDHADLEVIYMPYDRVEIAKDPRTGGPAFGFVYNEQGGIMNFMVSAGYSSERRRLIDEYRKKGKAVKPLPIISGGWSLTIDSGETSFFAGVTQRVETVLPDVPVAMSIQLKPIAVAYVVHALKTGADIGMNYNYTFRGVLTPLTVRASVNFHAFSRSWSESSATARATCEDNGDVSGGNSATAKACATSTRSVMQVVRRAVEKNTIKIYSMGEVGSERYDRQIQEVTNMILMHSFKPLPSLWKPLEVTAPTLECSVSGSGRYHSRCAASATAYAYRSDETMEDRSVEVEIVSQGVQTVPGAVGFSFSYMCSNYPQLIRYAGGARQGGEGCPTEWTDQGIQTPETGGPEVAPPRPESPHSPPPIVRF